MANDASASHGECGTTCGAQEMTQCSVTPLFFLTVATIYG
jgi:hypothetical protein